MSRQTSQTTLQAAPPRGLWGQIVRSIDRFADRFLPHDINRVTVWLAIASLISEVGIIVTGGAVRLTQSGLGCPTWPRCTSESLTNTPEMGIHGVIEFGNRLLTFVLAAIALAMVLALWNRRRTHPQVFWFATGLLLGIPGQAIIGGITVLTQLNPWVVAFHFLLSSAMVCFATLMVNRLSLELRVRQQNSSQMRLVDGETTVWTRRTAAVIFVVGWIVLYLGTIVTGTGPHGGDAGAPRHGFDPLVVTRVHSFPVYLMVIATVVLLLLVMRNNSSARQRRSAWFMIAMLIYQGGIGYIQHFTGLPIGVVLLHMLGTGLVVWAMTLVWDRQRSSYQATLVGTQIDRRAGDGTTPAADSLV